MPTGKFEGDFTDFNTAVDKANTKLADFSKGADRVEASLNRMVDEFQGRKLIQDLTLTASAVERAGGVAKLTADEITRLGTAAAQATEKAAKMGIVLPDSVQKYVSSIQLAQKETGGFKDIISDFGKEVAAAFTVDKVVDFVLNIGTAQAELVKLSKETQITTDDLQTLTYATKEYGLSNEELGRALFDIGRKLAGGDEGLTRGLHAIGLSLDDVRDKHGKELFLEIEAGLAKLTGSARDLAAEDIFGKKLGSQMAGFAKEANEGVAAGDKFVHTTKEETEALANYHAEVLRGEEAIKTYVDKGIGQLIIGYGGLAKALQDGMSGSKAWIALVQDQGVAGQHTARAIEEFYAALAKAATYQKDVNLAVDESTQELSKEAQAEQFLSKTRTDAAKELEPYQRRGLEALRDMGQLNQQNAAQIGVGVDQYKQYVEGVTRAEAATKRLAAATRENAEIVAKIKADEALTETKKTGTDDDIKRADIAKTTKDQLAELEKRRQAEKDAAVESHNDSVANLAAIDATFDATAAAITDRGQQMANDVGIDFEEIRKGSAANLQEGLNDAIRTLNAAEHSGLATRAEIDKLRGKVDDARDKLHAMGEEGVNANKKAAAATIEHFDAVAALNNELAKEEELHKAINRTISFTYDLSTAAGMAQFRAMNPDAIVTATIEYFKTHNIADAVAAGLITGGGFSQKGALAGGATGFTPAPAAPAAPASPAATTTTPMTQNPLPLPPPPAAPRGMQVNVNVSGVFDPSSSHALGAVVSDALAKTVTSARVLGGWS